MAYSRSKRQFENFILGPPQRNSHFEPALWKARKKARFLENYRPQSKHSNYHLVTGYAGLKIVTGVTSLVGLGLFSVSCCQIQKKQDSQVGCTYSPR